MSDKPRAIFLCNSPHTIPRAYDESTVSRMRELVKLDGTVHTDADLSGLTDVCYVFSTWGMPCLSEAQIGEYLPSLKAVFYAAGSVQHFALPFLKRGIAVHSAWGANGVPVAEIAYAEILLANKGFYRCPGLFRTEGKRRAAEYHLTFPGNYNTRVGILGAGMIGSMVAEKLKSNDLEVLVFDPFASDEKLNRLGAVRADLNEVFESCQTVTCHLANNDQTRGMLTYEQFSRMPENATFINTGRGAQVVESDLVRALTECPDRTAVLDVTFPEPPEEGHPFYSMPNVFLTPHLAGSSSNEIARMGTYMAEECDRTLSGEPVRWRVSEEMLRTMA